MPNVSEFSDDLFEEIDYYVYRLIDPRNKETFYVGKGQGNRVFEHAKGVGKFEADGGILTPKLNRIKDILASGNKVEYPIHRWGINLKRILGDNLKMKDEKQSLRLLAEKIAYEVEAAIIDCYSNLANHMDGHHSDRYGTTTVQNLSELVSKEEIVFDKNEPVLLLGISRVFPRKGVSTRDNIYEAARFAWPLSFKRASSIKYVLAHREGTVIAIYENLKWRAVTPRNFPSMPKRMKTAYSTWKRQKLGFDGTEVTTGSVAEQRYLRKKVPKFYRGSQSGVKYAP